MASCVESSGTLNSIVIRLSKHRLDIFDDCLIFSYIATSGITFYLSGVLVVQHTVDFHQTLQMLLHYARNMREMKMQALEVELMYFKSRKHMTKNLGEFGGK